MKWVDLSRDMFAPENLIKTFRCSCFAAYHSRQDINPAYLYAYVSNSFATLYEPSLILIAANAIYFQHRFLVSRTKIWKFPLSHSTFELQHFKLCTIWKKLCLLCSGKLAFLQCPVKILKKLMNFPNNIPALQIYW